MSPPLRYCVLQPSYKGSSSLFANHDTWRDLQPLLPNEEVRHEFLEVNSITGLLYRSSADVFINLCDGSRDQDVPGIEVVRALEREGRAFTGAGSGFYEPTRLAMKMACTAAGVRTPAYFMIRTEREIDEACHALALPCFLKPLHGYGSVGIDSGSKVTTVAALRDRALLLLKNFGGALAEEYVDGREYSVMVGSNPEDETQPFAYLPVETELGPELKWKTFDFKWKLSSNPYVPCQDGKLASQLIAMTRAIFCTLGGSGYARSDIRVDRNGTAWFLEINPNPSIFYSPEDAGAGDLILKYDGIGQAGFLRRLIDFALFRSRRSRSKFAIRYDRERGHGLYAARDIAAGEEVYSLEQSPQTLVSRAKLEQTLQSASEKPEFPRFAYPLTDEIWVLGSRDPDEWRPINHSCDPNVWFDGLSVTARRDIPSGEELTLDYATMHGDRDAESVCHCGPQCRTIWRGSDHLQRWFMQRYGSHVTNYIRSRQQRAGLH